MGYGRGVVHCRGRFWFAGRPQLHLRSNWLVVDGNRRRQPLHTVLDERHHDQLAIELLHLATAVAKSDRARGALAALARRTFP